MAVTLEKIPATHHMIFTNWARNHRGRVRGNELFYHLSYTFITIYGKIKFNVDY
jgi:hypothetical protein